MTVSRQIRDYFAAQPPDRRRALKRIRAAIRAAAPSAVEHFSYGIPGFRLNGKTFLWYAGWKEHTSLYPMSAAVRRAHAAALEQCETSTGTIRFPLAHQPSDTLLRRLIKARMAEMKSK